MSLLRDVGFYNRVLGGWLTVHKFGENDTITTATDPEDIWDVGGTVTVANVFPAAAATTVLVCANTADDYSDSGTGARTVTVEGIANDGSALSQTVQTDGNGTGSTTLGTNLKAVNRMYVATAGSGETNAGLISCTINGNTVSQILAGQGQTQQTVYTVPTGYSKYYITKWSLRLTGIVASAEAECFLVRRTGGVVRYLDHCVVNKGGTSAITLELDNWIEITAGDNIWVRVQEVSATVGVSATFDLVGVP